MSMSVPILLIVIQILIKVDTAPKLGHVLVDPLSLEAAEINDSDDEFLSNDEPTLSPVINKIAKGLNMEIVPANKNTNNNKENIKNVRNNVKDTVKATPQSEIKLAQVWKRLRETSNAKYEPVQAIPKRNKSYRKSDDTYGNKPCAGYDYDISNCKYIGDRFLCGYNKNLGEIKNNDDNIQDMGNGCFMHGDRIECGYQSGFNTKDNNKRSPDGKDSDTKMRVRNDFEAETINLTTFPTDTEQLRTKREVETTGTDEKEKLNNITEIRKIEIEIVTESVKVEITQSKVASTTSTVPETVKVEITKSSVANATATVPETVKVGNTDSKITDAAPAITEIIVPVSKTTVGTDLTNNTSVSATSNNGKKKACVEKNDHVFCYDLE